MSLKAHTKCCSWDEAEENVLVGERGDPAGYFEPGCNSGSNPTPLLPSMARGLQRIQYVS